MDVGWDEIGPDSIRAEGRPISSVCLLENMSGGRDLVLCIELHGEAMLLEPLFPVKPVEALCIPPFIASVWVLLKPGGLLT